MPVGAPSRGGRPGGRSSAARPRTTTTGEPSSRGSAPSGNAVRNVPDLERRRRATGSPCSSTSARAARQGDVRVPLVRRAERAERRERGRAQRGAGRAAGRAAAGAAAATPSPRGAPASSAIVARRPCGSSRGRGSTTRLLRHHQPAGDDQRARRRSARPPARASARAAGCRASVRARTTANAGGDSARRRPPGECRQSRPAAAPAPAARSRPARARRARARAGSPRRAPRSAARRRAARRCRSATRPCPPGPGRCGRCPSRRGRRGRARRQHVARDRVDLAVVELRRSPKRGIRYGPTRTASAIWSASRRCERRQRRAGDHAAARRATWWQPAQLAVNSRAPVARAMPCGDVRRRDGPARRARRRRRPGRGDLRRRRTPAVARAPAAAPGRTAASGRSQS